ncbi:CaiB/BaiF CoA-transferase family protein [Cryobacterium sp. Y57]|uniref:CaiB/BaiF CoA transferase family protein n=1 Tax=Cryobacterium sp. Y57 TaxID=2048287 RepID=UPI001E3F4978|nr:CaiB/BaiF CoA-transferase family protein [Cryobacterium sp. Y57]
MMTEGPLAGVTVIEAGSLIAGPYCGQLLGDLGARVIKIEPPVTGDAFRTWGEHSDDGDGVWWATLGRNKESVTLNLRTPQGQDIFRDLCAKADVLVENFRPGTLAKWGIGPATLMAENPRLIVAQVSGYGQTGPYAQRAGYASIGEAMAGLRHITGYPDRAPVRVGISLGDSMAGIFSTIGVLAALNERHASGNGQTVDTSIYESVLALSESMLPDYSMFGKVRERSGPVLAGIAPSNAYETRDGASVLIAANQDTVFKRLCTIMERDDLIYDEQFATHGARGANMELIDSIIEDWTRTIESNELLDVLANGGVPAGRVNRAPEILADPQVIDRESVAWVEDPNLGRMPMPNVTPRLGRTPGSIRTTGPQLGEHTDSVLRDVLGYTDDAIEGLHANAHI